MSRDRSEKPVVLSRIYTRTGDDGTTALGDGSRTVKTDSRLAAYADVDEANCAIGVAITFGDLASGVAPHPVGNDEQQRIAAIGIGEPVLIDLALALAALLKDGELHGLSCPYMTSLNSFFFSVSRNVSLRLRGGISRIAFCSANTLCGRSSGSRRKHQSMTSSRLSE